MLSSSLSLAIYDIIHPSEEERSKSSLLASTIFFATGAQDGVGGGVVDGAQPEAEPKGRKSGKWNDEQSWQVISVENKPTFDASDPKNAKETANWIRKKTQRVRGKEPFAVTMDKSGKARVWYRKRDK